MDSSPEKEPSVVESTSKRLAGLDLIETNLKAENMDEVETDVTLIIPDTPDRLMAVRQEENVGKGANPSSSFGLSRRTNHHYRSSHVPYTEGNNADSLDTESLFRRAKLASMMPNSLEVGTSGPQTLRTRTSPEQDTILPHDQPSSSNMPGLSTGGSRIPSDISYHSRCRLNDRKNGKYFHDEGRSHSSSELNEVVSSPSQLQPIRRPRSGTCVGSKLFSGTRQVDEAGPEASARNRHKPDVNHDLAPSKTLKFDVPPRSSSQRRLVRNGCISPCNTAKGVTPVYGGKCDLLAEGTCLSKGNGIDLASDLTDKTIEVIPNSLCFNPSRNSGQKVVVLNGFTSPLETAKTKIDGSGKMDHNENPHSKSPFPLHVISPDSEDRVPVKVKGKEILDETCQANGQDSRPRHSSRRLALKSAKESNLTGETLNNRCTEGAGWRTTQNGGKNVFNSVLEVNDESRPSSEHALENLGGEREHVNLVEDSPEINFIEASPMAHHPSVLDPVKVSSDKGPGSILEDLRNNGSQKFLKGKRKSRSARIQHGESSTSDMFGSLPFPSSGQNSNAIPTRNQNPHRHSINLPIIDVDELPSPELRHKSIVNGNHNVSDVSSSRDLQVESDELLARQLQEQLFNESLGLGGAEEIDASLAWTLQQEEDAQRASFVGSRRSQPRDASVAHLYRHYPRHSLQSSSGRSSNSTRAPSRMAQLRRSLNRRHTDLELRLNYLEALEAAFDDGNDGMTSNPLLRVERDFNENDYEMLLALDNDNHQHVGASVHQINSLPLSVIQNENSEEACAVCLESPSTGDTMRHLPCLHKFHKDCIDTWLRRKTSCPICKSNIT